MWCRVKVESLEGSTGVDGVERLEVDYGHGIRELEMNTGRKVYLRYSSS